MSAQICGCLPNGEPERKQSLFRHLIKLAGLLGQLFRHSIPNKQIYAEAHLKKCSPIGMVSALQGFCSGSHNVQKHYDSAGGSHPSLKKPPPRLRRNTQFHEIQ